MEKVFKERLHYCISTVCAHQKTKNYLNNGWGSFIFIWTHFYLIVEYIFFAWVWPSNGHTGLIFTDRKEISYFGW